MAAAGKEEYGGCCPIALGPVGRFTSVEDSAGLARNNSNEPESVVETLCVPPCQGRDGGGGNAVNKLHGNQTDGQMSKTPPKRSKRKRRSSDTAGTVAVETAVMETAAANHKRRRSSRRK